MYYNDFKLGIHKKYFLKHFLLIELMTIMTQ